LKVSVLRVVRPVRVVRWHLRMLLKLWALRIRPPMRWSGCLWGAKLP